jgi:hypothetical protein
MAYQSISPALSNDLRPSQHVEIVEPGSELQFGASRDFVGLVSERRDRPRHI